MTEEYAAAREGSAVVDVAGRGILAVTGPQRIKFLHNIVSNDLQSRGPGQGTLAAVMDVKGRLLVLLRALVTEDAVLLEMPEDRLDVIEALLVHYKVAAPVRFARREVAVLGLLGPRRGGDARPRGGDGARGRRAREPLRRRHRRRSGADRPGVGFPGRRVGGACRARAGGGGDERPWSPAAPSRSPRPPSTPCAWRTAGPGTAGT